MPKQKSHKGAIKRGYKPPRKQKNIKDRYIEKRIREGVSEKNNGEGKQDE